MSGEWLSIEDFLNTRGTWVDVRSPSEFRKGHIPGAVNIPLLDDTARHITGQVYAREGRFQAVLQALNETKDRLPGILETLNETCAGGPCLLYCWRGGMRSGSVAFLARSAGLKAYTLEGGYKAFRKQALHIFQQNWKIRIIGGMTGIGKTSLLKRLKQAGHQVIDLEGLANHRGSVFGGIGQTEQPTSEHFENLIWKEFSSFNPEQLVLMEDESTSIGHCLIPQSLFQKMLRAPLMYFTLPLEDRIHNITLEYSSGDTRALVEAVNKLNKRLGRERSLAIIRDFENADFSAAAEKLLNYYDNTYSLCLAKRNPRTVFNMGKINPDAIENIVAFANRLLPD